MYNTADAKCRGLGWLRVKLRLTWLEYRSYSPLRKLVVAAGCALALVLAYKLLVYIFITNIKHHTELEKCPACFGSRICARIHETSVHGKERFHHVNALTNVKNVYFGEINGVQIVYKKLAHDDELAAADGHIRAGGLTPCRGDDGGYDNPKLCVAGEDARGTDWPLKSGIKEIQHQISGPLTSGLVRRLHMVLECPSDRLVQRFVDRFQERSVIRHANKLNDDDKFMLLYTLSINPEPIILQSFPAGEGWPFPPYIGACGRVVAMENCGKTLREYFHADWKTRVKLSLRLLKIAEMLTDNASAFKLYFTDLGLDNYVVDANLNVVIADAEDIIIVDEQQVLQDKPDGYGQVHRSLYDDCPDHRNCLTIDPATLCQRTHSDFNYYAVCRSMLSGYAQDEQGDDGGLLHSPPDAGEAAAIHRLANQCARPGRDGDRFSLAEQLMRKLELEEKRLGEATSRVTQQ